MQTRRVAITGLGAISALGHDVREYWEALRQGRHGFGPIEAVDRSLLRFENGAEVRRFDPMAHFEPKRADLLDRFSQFAVVAAREAVRDARLEWSSTTRPRTAVITGSCLGGRCSDDRLNEEIYRESRTRAHPLSVPRIMTNAATSHITIEFGTTGPSYTVSSACASSNHAIGQAFWMVRQGLADVAITGGSEATFSLVHLKAWEAMRVVAPDVCRPFSKDRRGLVLGEGAGILILEDAETARARGAPILAEVVGFGMSCDAHHLTMPSSEGAAQAMRAALDDARIAPEQVGYINAHGTGTLVNDPMETRAIRSVFGAHADRLAVSSTKSMHGHALGASSALEAVATVLALRHGLLPPTSNFTEADPQCDLDVVPNEARPAEVEYALSHSFAFGGLNAVLAFRRWDGRPSLG
jgi:nodulation protein E